MLTVTEIANLEQLEAFRQPWQELLDQTDSDNLFLTHEWVYIWLKHFWAPKPLQFLLASENDEPLALAPLLHDTERGEIKFPVNGYSHRPDFLIAKEKERAVRAIFAHLIKNQSKPRFYLHQVEAASVLPALMPDVGCNLKLVHIIKESHKMPYLSMDGDWQVYLKTRSKHFRKEQKRKLNKIRKAGSVELRVITNSEQCNLAFQDILRIEKNSWKEKAGTSFTADPRLAPFYKEIADVFSRKGCLRIYMLYFNAAPIAHIFGITYRNKYYALKTSYDNNYRQLSPGVVIFNYALDDAFKLKFREFDFLGVESRWKNELTSQVREHFDLYIYPRGPLSIAKRSYEHNVKPFVRTRLPFLLQLKRKIWNAQNRRN